jgi:hypothetical protein
VHLFGYNVAISLTKMHGISGVKILCSEFTLSLVKPLYQPTRLFILQYIKNYNEEFHNLLVSLNIIRRSLNKGK